MAREWYTVKNKSLKAYSHNGGSINLKRLTIFFKLQVATLPAQWSQKDTIKMYKRRKESGIDFRK